jgi:multimeric flavodoxin WrbA
LARRFAVKVLGIMGSPRIKGNTDIILNEALKGAQNQGAEVEKIIVDNLKISGCKEYYGCFKDGNCVIRDDMDIIYPKLLEFDRIIVASPMFFYGIPSQLKALIDRCQATWSRKYILKKTISKPGRKGAFIAVGATRGKDLFEGSKLVIKYFFKAIDIEYSHELFIRGIDKKAEIKDYPDTITEAFELGQHLIQ